MTRETTPLDHIIRGDDGETRDDAGDRIATDGGGSPTALDQIIRHGPADEEDDDEGRLVTDGGGSPTALDQIIRHGPADEEDDDEGRLVTDGGKSPRALDQIIRHGPADEEGDDESDRDDRVATDGGESVFGGDTEASSRESTADAPESRITGELPGPSPEERPSPRGERTEGGTRADAGDDETTRRAVLSALVRHEPGVLASVAGLFSRRNFNIQSLTVGPTTDDDYARITLIAEESAAGIAQVRKQLSGLVQVVDVTELPADATERELALVKVDATHADRVRTVVETYDGSVVDACSETITVEVTGSGEAVDAAIATFDEAAVREIARPGPTALAPGSTPTADADPRDEPTTNDAATTDER